jgi:hypothetical protein
MPPLHHHHLAGNGPGAYCGVSHTTLETMKAVFLRSQSEILMSSTSNTSNCRELKNVLGPTCRPPHAPLRPLPTPPAVSLIPPSYYLVTRFMPSTTRWHQQSACSQGPQPRPSSPRFSYRRAQLGWHDDAPLATVAHALNPLLEARDHAADAQARLRRPVFAIRRVDGCAALVVRRIVEHHLLQML